MCKPKLRSNPVYLQIWNYFTVQTEQADSKFTLSIEPRVHDGIIFIADEGGIVYIVRFAHGI